jgi:hypothetical protein
LYGSIIWFLISVIPFEKKSIFYQSYHSMKKNPDLRFDAICLTKKYHFASKKKTPDPH